jgi:diguanylate cyclase (GGDEF)-like protein
MDAGETRVFSRDSGLPAARILGIRRDATGTLWVTAEGFGIFVWPVGKQKFERPQLSVPPSSIREVPVVDSDGRTLLPSPGGLLIRDKSGWQKIDRSFGLRGLVNTVFEDRQHTLWIGMGGRGLVVWRGYREWQNYSTESGLASDIVYGTLPLNDGSLWVGTGSGLLRGEPRKSGMAFTTVPGFSAIAVHSLCRAPNGDIWIGSEGRGVARIEPRRLTATWFGEPEGLAGKDIYNLRFDRENRLLVATEVGLFMASAPYRRFSRIDELPDSRMWAIVQAPDGTLWVGGDSGLFALQAGRWKTFTPADGLSNRQILSLSVGPDGEIWVGYSYGGGIDRVHPRPGGLIVEKAVQRNGTQGVIYFLEFDSKGRLWAGTQHGVDVWDGARWSHYDMNDGLVWDDCDTNGFSQGKDGAYWIGTSGGLSRFTPRQDSSLNASLEVLITRLTISGKDVSGLRNPSFGSGAGSLVARFSAINASRQNSLIFRYRLDATSNWTETSQRELQFANLAPGYYLLQIQAGEGDGEWSRNNAEFPFRILTPWYLTWWFAGVYLMIPVSAVAAVLRLRFLSAQKRERELVKVVEEKTAELRQANEELSRLSFTDPLTGLANRRVLDQILNMECSRVKRVNSQLSLLSIDVDQFKALNDSQGHQKGDECLMLLGAELTRLCRRQTDIAARCGGEEFAIVLMDTGAEYAIELAESVRQAIEALSLPHPASSISPFLTVSVGVATATREWCFTPEAILAAADQALYSAKRAGRNRVCVAKPGPENSRALDS